MLIRAGEEKDVAAVREVNTSAERSAYGNDNLAKEVLSGKKVKASVALQAFPNMLAKYSWRPPQK